MVHSDRNHFENNVCNMNVHYESDKNSDMIDEHETE